MEHVSVVGYLNVGQLSVEHFSTLGLNVGHLSMEHLTTKYLNI